MAKFMFGEKTIFLDDESIRLGEMTYNSKIHEVFFNYQGIITICRCGFDPWELLATENSGPDEDTVKSAMFDHLNSARIIP